MKSLKTLLLTKSIIAAAVAAGSLAAPAVSHAITAAGSPIAGMLCRTGYTPAFTGTRLTCSKTSVIPLELVCDRPNFPGVLVPGVGVGPVVRAAGAAGDNSGGKDLCPRTGLTIGTTDSLVGLTRGTDYVFATVDPAAVATRTANNDLAEATALGLTVGEVDTVAGTPVINVNQVGAKDKGSVTLTFFTFAIPGPGIIISNPGPIVGVPALSSAPFVPQPLPPR
jgi:hypothetical protein